MSLIRYAISGAGLGLLVLVSSCKERGEATREGLSEAGYQVSQEEFFRAAESDDVRAMKKMIEAGLALDSMDIKSRTALHAAAGSGAMQSINFMLDRRMPIDVTDSSGRTPLMEAVLRSTPETVRYLLRQGADPSLKDHEHYKPLMLAVRDARTNMVPELAAYVRGDLDDALLAASILGQAGVIDELTNFGASIYARIEDGRTPLMLAAQNGHDAAVDMLLAIGANRFAMDEQGRMAADLAEENGHQMLAARLAEEPREGDFELSEPAELGIEMANMVEDHSAEAETLAVNAAPEQGEAVAEMQPWNESIPGQGEGALGAEPPAEHKPSPEPLEGAVVSAVVANMPVESAPGEVRSADLGGPIVMRSYRQRELPLRVEAAESGVATMRMAGGEAKKIGEGSTIPGTSLKVVRVHRKMQSGKENAGEPVEVSVVEVKDTNTGMTRDLVADLPALAHDPVALVEDSTSGRYYVARAGQRFRSSDGNDYLVADVRPNQLVIEDMKTHETTTIPLRGPRG